MPNHKILSMIKVLGACFYVYIRYILVRKLKLIYFYKGVWLFFVESKYKVNFCKLVKYFVLSNYIPINHVI